MRRTLLTLLACTALLAAAAPPAVPAKPAAPRTLVDPTPLRPLPRAAVTAQTDGERFVLVGYSSASGLGDDVHDTFTGRRVRLDPDCSVTGSFMATAGTDAGRGLFWCPAAGVYRLIDLASGSTLLDLPTALEVGGVRYDDVRFAVPGRRWISGTVGCLGRVTCATVYYDHRTGETRPTTPTTCRS